MCDGFIPPISHITSILPRLQPYNRRSFVSAEKAGGGREWDKKLLLPRTKACQSKRYVSAAPLECGVMGKLFTGTAVGAEVERREYASG